MQREQEIREILINNTIHLIAEGGFEKATTHAIAFSGVQPSTFKMNEVYIYRFFGGKEKLYAAAFAKLDTEIHLALCGYTDFRPYPEQDVKSQLYEAFLKTWGYILTNEAYCRCYARYYYSVYFKDESFQTHNRLFDGIVERFAPLFKEGTDVKFIMHGVFTTMIDYAVWVHNGDFKSTVNTTEHVFNVTYGMMVTFLKDAKI